MGDEYKAKIAGASHILRTEGRDVAPGPAKAVYGDFTMNLGEKFRHLSENT
jgi:hypothetical protein